MRRSELTAGQRAERQLLVEALIGAGWESWHETEFEADQYLPHEAELSSGPHRAYYQADSRSVRVIVRPDATVLSLRALELEVTGAIGTVGRVIADSGALLAGDPLGFTGALLSTPGVRVSARKGDDLIALAPAGLAEPQFVPVPLAAVRFNLAQLVRGDFFLAQAELATALDRCLAAIRAGELVDLDPAGLDEVPSFVALLGELGATVMTDAQGNVVGLDQDGDGWVLDVLDVVADLIRDGCFFLIQDDRYLFWRVEYTGPQAQYHRENVVVPSWRLNTGPDRLTGAAAARHIAQRIDQGAFEHWLEHPSGRMLALLSNGNRAMVILFEYAGDPGEHAIDLDAGPGQQDGYRLDNGQNDTYPDRETVPLPLALSIVEHVIDRGVSPTTVTWQVDR